MEVLQPTRKGKMGGYEIIDTDADSMGGPVRREDVATPRFRETGGDAILDSGA